MQPLSAEKNQLENFMQIILTFIVLVLINACAVAQVPDNIPGNGTAQNVEIQVGTRKITTNKITSKGIPVVPMWNTQTAQGDIRTGAGFPLLHEAQHTSVWQPANKEEGAYNHYACLIHFNGKFYAMWGNHIHGEDAPGQRVLYAESETWGEWSEPKELFPAPGPVKPRNESGIHLKPDRWAISEGKLFAITYVHGAGVYPIARELQSTGEMSAAFSLDPVNPSQALPVFMDNSTNETLRALYSDNLKNWYSENNQISWWASTSWGVNRKAVDGSSLIESFMYKANDGTSVLMLRNWGTPSNPVHNNRIYVSFDDGTGDGWNMLYPTDIPDSPTRTQAIKTEEGRTLLVGSQNVSYFDQALYLDRDPLTISISEDGYSFDKIFTLRTDSPKSFRIPGISGRNPGYAYTSSIIHEGSLYTLYSIGKEDMGISRVPLNTIK